jgi:hypothetical protein
MNGGKDRAEARFGVPGLDSVHRQLFAKIEPSQLWHEVDRSTIRSS